MASASEYMNRIERIKTMRVILESCEENKSNDMLEISSSDSLRYVFVTIKVDGVEKTIKVNRADFVRAILSF